MGPHIEMSQFEKQNKHDIHGWEVHYGFKNVETKSWEQYQGFKMVIFNMKDGSVKEFKIPVWRNW